MTTHKEIDMRTYVVAGRVGQRGRKQSYRVEVYDDYPGGQPVEVFGPFTSKKQADLFVHNKTGRERFTTTDAE